MAISLRKTAALLALLGGAALVSGPALGMDLDEGDFGGTYNYIGPGVASLGPVFEEDVPVYPAPVPPPEAYAGPAYGTPPAVIVAPPMVEEEYFGPGAPEPLPGPELAVPVGID
jgi:hypothetical protein